jgi:hypothetical protein
MQITRNHLNWGEHVPEEEYGQAPDVAERSQ